MGGPHLTKPLPAAMRLEAHGGFAGVQREVESALLLKLKSPSDRSNSLRRWGRQCRNRRDGLRRGRSRS